MYKIRNVSDNDLVINEKITINPKCEIEVSDLKPLHKVIQLGYVEVEQLTDINVDIYNKYLKNKNIKEIQNNTEIIDFFIDNNIKSQLIESFFNYHFNNTTEKDISLLKWFYKEVCFTKDIDNEILNLIDNAENAEELTEILLNNIYPALLDLYLINEVKE